MKKKTIVEGPFGIKMTADVARSMETLLKTLPKTKEFAYRKKSTSADVSFEPGERASIDLITTDAVDKDKEVVLPDGLSLEQFRKNPVVFFNHDTARPPIGKSLWIKATPNGLKSKTQYAYRPQDFQGDFLPDLVFALVQQDILRGRSIGFIPTQIDPPTMKQLEARPDWKAARIIISKGWLFEYSVVGVPCNSDALQVAVSKGLKDISMKQLESLGLALPMPKQIDENKLLLKMLDQIRLDPDAIAKKAIEALRNRGRV